MVKKNGINKFVYAVKYTKFFIYALADKFTLI